MTTFPYVSHKKKFKTSFLTDRVAQRFSRSSETLLQLIQLYIRGQNVQPGAQFCIIIVRQTFATISANMIESTT